MLHLNETISAPLLSTPEQFDWCPNSWQNFAIRQQPKYQDAKELARVLTDIKRLPPLVSTEEVDRLKHVLQEAAQGKSFVLQGGDCAERFVDCHPVAISSKIKILLQMSTIIAYGTNRSVVRIGRIAGQYAKPRSLEFETIDGELVPVFRGDSVNAYEANRQKRQPDPARLLQGYHMASATLNYIRALMSGPFAGLSNIRSWNVDLQAASCVTSQYQEMADSIAKIWDFMCSFHGSGHGQEDHNRKPLELYTSHEGLLLNYEEAMTRFSEERQAYYNTSAHMLWIGDRTRQLTGAHVEYFRGIANPIAIKWGPDADPNEMMQIIARLNPKGELGKVTVITRFGTKKVRHLLPEAIKALQSGGSPVLWSCDPMHGNNILSKNLIKTRDFNAILDELQASIKIHKQCGSHMSGVHFEMTGEHVTECLGGSVNVKEHDLLRNYETFCDPRLNYSQSLEMAFQLAQILK